jgi:hypothetical protein
MEIALPINTAVGKTKALWEISSSYPQPTSLPPSSVLSPPHNYNFSPVLLWSPQLLQEANLVTLLLSSIRSPSLPDGKCELMGWLPRSFLLLYNPTFLHAMCIAFFLLHAGFLPGLLGGDTFPRIMD